MSPRGGMRRHGRRGERGSSVVSFVGIMPIVLVLVMLFLQLGAAAYATNAASRSARNAARARSLGQDWQAAARNAAGGSEVRSVTAAQDHGVTVTVAVAGVWPVGDGTVSRTVVMP